MLHQSSCVLLNTSPSSRLFPRAVRLLLTMAAPVTGVLFFLFAFTGTVAAREQQVSAVETRWYWNALNARNWLRADGDTSVPCFLRKSFDLPRKIRGATLNVTGHGNFRFFINGQPLAALQYTRAWSSIDAVDIADYLVKGRNVFAAEIEGGAAAQGLIVQAVLVFDDWSAVTITTDLKADPPWKASRQGANGWEKPAFDDSAWTTAVIGNPPWMPGGAAGHFELVEVSAPAEAVNGENLPVTMKLKVKRKAEGDPLLFMELSTDNVWFGRSTYHLSPPAHTWDVGDEIVIRVSLIVREYLRPGNYTVKPSLFAARLDGTNFPTVKVQRRFMGYSTALLERPDALFAVIADSHFRDPNSGHEELKKMPRYLRQEIAKSNVDELNLLHPDFVIHCGDMVTGWPEREDFDVSCKAATEAYARLVCPIHYAAGNHDVANSPKNVKSTPESAKIMISAKARKLYEKWFGPDWFSVDHGGFHLVCYNNNLTGSGLADEKEQMQWMRKDLEKARQASHRVLAAHIVPFWVDLETDAEEGSYETVYREGQHELMELMKKTGVRAFYAGHTHYEITAELDGIEFWTAPSTTFARSHYDYCRFSPMLTEVDERKCGYLVGRTYGKRLVNNAIYPYTGLELPHDLQKGNTNVVSRLVSRKAEEVSEGHFGLCVREVPEIFWFNDNKTTVHDRLWHSPAQAGLKWVLHEGDGRVSKANLFRGRKPALPQAVRRAYTIGKAKGVRYMLSVDPSESAGDPKAFARHVGFLFKELSPTIEACHLPRRDLSPKDYCAFARAAKDSLPKNVFLVGEIPLSKGETEEDLKVLKPILGGVLVQVHPSEVLDAGFEDRLRAVSGSSGLATDRLFVKILGWDDPLVPIRTKQVELSRSFQKVHRLGAVALYAPGAADDHGLFDQLLDPMDLYATCQTLSTLLETPGRWLEKHDFRADGAQLTEVFRREDGATVVWLDAGDKRELGLHLPYGGKCLVVDPITGSLQEVVSKVKDKDVVLDGLKPTDSLLALVIYPPSTR